MEVYHNQEWSRQSRFASFWAHYRAAQNWRRQHIQFASLSNQITNGDYTVPSSSSPVLDCNPTTSTTLPLTEEESTQEQQYNLQEEAMEEDEISEEYKQFMMTTIQHKRDREIARDAANKKAEETPQSDAHWDTINDQEYVLADKIGVHGIQQRSFASPDAQSENLQRRNEALQRYGSSASKILAMETLLDMRFDQEYTRTIPNLWPNIPLNL